MIVNIQKLQFQKRARDQFLVKKQIKILLLAMQLRIFYQVLVKFQREQTTFRKKIMDKFPNTSIRLKKILNSNTK